MKYFLMCAILSALMISGCKDNAKISTQYMEPLSIVAADGTTHHFKVEIANTPEQKVIGLMFRDHMPEDAGMLFVFEDEVNRSFWMRNTLIPLDMVFIRRDGTIDSIHENAIPRDETPCPSDGPAMAVLEINGGLSAKLGLKAGQVVKHKVFGNTLAEPAAIH